MAKWIWLKNGQMVDSHADFFIPLNFSGEKTEIKLSVDSDYTLYVNGRFVSCNQYRDYPFYKIYDEIDITEYLIKGENAIAIEVWYYGAPNWSYYTSNAGLWYEIFQDGKKVKESDENTLSRLSPLYQNKLQRKISPQIGWGYHYIAANEDGWRTKLVDGFETSAIAGEGIMENPLPRPIKRMDILPAAESTFVREANNRILYDLGKETVGFPTLRLTSPVKQKLRLMWGEHIEDGQVRDVIGCRNFYVDLTVDEGVTEFSNYLRRFGCRYLEIGYETPVKVDYLTVFPCFYPVNIVPFTCKNELRQRIYDTALRTLWLCMHDHYEDCPWREQAMYIGDSRNQSLCGYYAFKEYEFPRAALYLTSKNDHREDGLLTSCTPYKGDMHPIPSAFPSSPAAFITSVYEYCLHSKDYAFIPEVYPRLKRLADLYFERMEDGLIPIFPEADGCWNFYEWAEGLSYYMGQRPATASPFDAALNCRVSWALGYLHQLCEWAGIESDYKQKQEALNKRIHETWFNKNTGFIQNRTDEEFYSEYVNSMAVLCGAVTGDEAAHIAEGLVNNKMSTCSLAWKCLKYDALIKVNKAKYRDYILDDIDQRYKKMLDAGATTFWETVVGANDFDNAGSLCHGWSAMPIYYYQTLEADKD
ncbi:MAG: hypothetical protein J6D16_06510 [Clostridia bacterium]|nr:hypothetical protein [Clostridia bacterium]